MNSDKSSKTPKKMNRDLNTPPIHKNRNPCDSCMSNPKNGVVVGFCHCTLGSPIIQ